MTDEKPDYLNHHIWCNKFMLPSENCKMCEGLRKKYPMNGKTPDELLKEHFPNVVKIKG